MLETLPLWSLWLGPPLRSVSMLQCCAEQLFSSVFHFTEESLFFSLRPRFCWSSLACVTEFMSYVTSTLKNWWSPSLTHCVVWSPNRWKRISAQIIPSPSSSTSCDLKVSGTENSVAATVFRLCSWESHLILRYTVYVYTDGQMVELLWVTLCFDI